MNFLENLNQFFSYINIHFILSFQEKEWKKIQKIYRLRKFPQLFCQDDYFHLTPEMLFIYEKKWSESYFIKSYQNI